MCAKERARRVKRGGEGRRGCYDGVVGQRPRLTEGRQVGGVEPRVEGHLAAEHPRRVEMEASGRGCCGCGCCRKISRGQMTDLLKTRRRRKRKRKGRICRKLLRETAAAGVVEEELAEVSR